MPKLKLSGFWLTLAIIIGAFGLYMPIDFLMDEDKIKNNEDRAIEYIRAFAKDPPGTIIAGEGLVIETPGINNPFVSELMTRFMLDKTDLIEESGYYFKFYAPIETDMIWRLYAFPIIIHENGRRTFYVDAEGTVLQNSGIFSGDRTPARYTYLMDGYHWEKLK